MVYLLVNHRCTGMVTTGSGDPVSAEIPGFTGNGIWVLLAACASRDEIRPGPIMEHGIQNNHDKTFD